jgi:outer membrane receptor protein involved in Fe transport
MNTTITKTNQIEKNFSIAFSVFIRYSYRTLMRLFLVLVFLYASLAEQALSQNVAQREISGTVATANGEVVPGVTVEIRSGSAAQTVISDETGNFKGQIALGEITIRLGGKNIRPVSYNYKQGDNTENLSLLIEYIIPPIYAELVINASQLEPNIERRNDQIYNDTLFSRDDQIFQTLDSGITAGQHEGGGKSLEIRRFGFNLDHGGVNGGLKVLTDNVQQNQGTQGHGQGYLGALKSLSPELVEAVDIVNGPFSAEYGDFSGLGVVHIRTRQSLPHQFTARLQGGRFNTGRVFFAYSPPIKDATFIAIEHSQTDGPFLQPLKYRRDNVTGNYTFKLSESRAFGVKLNFSRNDFRSSGQIPLDEVASGNLDRFGFVDPDNGGKVRSGTLGLYFRDEDTKGRVLKIDAFASRSLFDLYSNFTFFLNDPAGGDEIVQHDSRLQEGVNAQYIVPVTFSGVIGAFTAGGNFHANQINVGLDRSIARSPVEIVTKANANVNNYAAYAQQSLDLFAGHLNLTFGLRYDLFTFNVKDRFDASLSGKKSAGKLQPKFGVAYTPSHRMPLTLHFNYGRGIVSQDARGVVRQPDGPKIAITDFYQSGVSYNSKRFSGSFDAFLIDRSNEQVYIPDDGGIELAGPSRAFGYEAKTSIRLNRFLSFNTGFTKVVNAFYRGTVPRVFVDSAPHLTRNAAFTLDGLYGFSGSLRYRHGSSYRLDGLDDKLRASGFDVLDLSVNKRVTKWLDLNFALDNLTNKRYFETQNFFESRVRPGDASAERIHVTPGYPLTFTMGVTIRLGKKE